MSDPAISTTVRCFRRLREERPIADQHLRCGVWLMTNATRGLFFHGDCDEVQFPRHTVEELAGGKTLFAVEEITPEEALAELHGWPFAATEAQAVFRRHPRAATEPDGPAETVRRLRAVTSSELHQTAADLIERLLATDAGKVLAALELTRGVVAWAQSAYCWEGFWSDLNWRPASQADQNGMKLRDFLREFEEVFPELQDRRPSAV